MPNPALKKDKIQQFIDELKARKTLATAIDTGQYLTSTLPKPHKDTKTIRQEIEELETQPIPKRIFFIAISKLPDDYLTNMLILAHYFKEEEDYEYEIELFVDNEKIIRQSLLNLSCDIEPFHQFQNIKIRNIQEIMLHLEELDIEEYEKEIIKKAVKEFQIGFYNFGLVSDILRYIELYYEGGYYLDWELIPSTTQEPQQLTGFKTTYQEDHDGKKGYANDLIGSCEKHPVLREMIRKLSRNLTFIEVAKVLDGQNIKLDKTLTNLLKIRDPRKENLENKKEMVIEITGPKLTRLTLKKFSQDKLTIKREKFSILGLKFDLQSHTTWLQTREDPQTFDTEFQGKPHDPFTKTTKPQKTLEEPSKNPDPTINQIQKENFQQASNKKGIIP